MSIVTTGISREFKSYRKHSGLIASVKGFFHREHIIKSALHPTSISIHPGDIVGLVGANGAGKTTLLKLLAGLIHPTSGDARVLGFQPWKRQHEFLRRIGILLGQKNQLWWDIPPADSYALLGKIYGISSATVHARVSELATRLNATDQLHIQLRRLSLGERMKMEIIGALLHRPEILFLDEPTIGLDILAQSSIRDFLREYVVAEKPTIILTSHYMDDIAQLANRLMLISKGAIVYDGDVASFTKSAVLKQRVNLKFDQPLARSIEIPDEHLSIKAGATAADVHLRSAHVSHLLKEVLHQSNISELQIEQTDFEAVIHEFLSKERLSSH